MLNANLSATPRASIWRRLHDEAVAPALASPAARCFAALWAFAALVLVATGHGAQVLNSTIVLVATMALCALTVLTTDPPVVAPVSFPGLRRRLWVQVAIVLVFAAITGYTALAFHRLIPQQAAYIPLWTPLVDWFGRLGERYLPVEMVGSPYNVVANPLKYFVLPLIALVLAGARPRDLGFDRGHRSWRVIALWCAIPVVIWAILLASGGLTLARLGRRLVSNSFQNGFFEEFLFRGALQTRLAALWSSGWALVGQALLFGLWHLGADARLMDGNLLAGLAATVVIQGTMGLGLGLIFQRTRNLLAPSVFHVVSNTIG